MNIGGELSNVADTWTTFEIKFKLPIVNDVIEYKNDKKKSDGYSLKDGKKSVKTDELLSMNGPPSKKS